MSNIAIGVDLAKSVFSTCTLDRNGRVVQRQELRRDAFAVWLASLAADTVVAMEACSSAHHWGRRCLDHGLQPRLMAAQFVKPFRKSQAAKNDRNDAEAKRIAETSRTKLRAIYIGRLGALGRTSSGLIPVHRRRTAGYRRVRRTAPTCIDTHHKGTCV